MKCALAASSAALLLAGCANIENMKLADAKEDFVFTSDVLYSFECEIVESLKGVRGDSSQTSDFFRNKAVKAKFLLTAKDVDSSSGGLSLTIPAGAVQVKLDPTLTPSLASTRIFSFEVTFSANRADLCQKRANGDREQKRIASGLGLGDWALQMERLGEASTGKLAVTSYQVKFDISQTNKLSTSASRTSGGLARSLSFSPSDVKSSMHSVTVSVVPLPSNSRAPNARIPKSVEDALRSNIDRFIEAIEP